MTKKILLSTVIFSLNVLFLHAQSDEKEISGITKKYGIETNLVWPFIPGINIGQLKFTPVIYKSEKQSGELILGFMYRNTSEDENAEVHKEIGGILGYRQFLFKGFHVEFNAQITSASAERNKIDNKDYNSPAVTTELYTGYRFELAKQNRISWYLIPQVGIGSNIYSKLGPETESSNGIFPIVSLLGGFRF